MNINPYLDFRIFLISATKSWKKSPDCLWAPFLSSDWIVEGQGAGHQTQDHLWRSCCFHYLLKRIVFVVFLLYNDNKYYFIIFLIRRDLHHIITDSKKIDKKNKKVISNLMSDQVTNYVFNPGRDQCSGVDVRPWSWLTFAVVGHVWQCGGVAAVFMETVVPLWKCGWR